MKPFDLEAAIRGEPVVTRDGRDAKFGAYNPDADALCSVVGWIGDRPHSWSKDGRFNFMDFDPRDLFMKTKTVERWVVVYNSDYHYSSGPYGSDFYTSKEQAEKTAYGNPVARVTWEE